MPYLKVENFDQENFKVHKKSGHCTPEPVQEWIHTLYHILEWWGLHIAGSWHKLKRTLISEAEQVIRL